MSLEWAELLAKAVTELLYAHLACESTAANSWFHCWFGLGFLGFVCLFSRTSMNCLMEEATKMEKIKFQHIVTIYGVCNSPLGIVMEYMARGSLEKILPTHKMSWQLKFRVIHEMGLAMNFLHSMTPPLLHLDLKPGNVLLDGNMHVKV